MWRVSNARSTRIPSPSSPPSSSNLPPLPAGAASSPRLLRQQPNSRATNRSNGLKTVFPLLIAVPSLHSHAVHFREKEELHHRRMCHSRGEAASQFAGCACGVRRARRCSLVGASVQSVRVERALLTRHIPRRLAAPLSTSYAAGVTQSFFLFFFFLFWILDM